MQVNVQRVVNDNVDVTQPPSDDMADRLVILRGQNASSQIGLYDTSEGQWRKVALPETTYCRLGTDAMISGGVVVSGAGSGPYKIVPGTNGSPDTVVEGW